jgi:hypothetical protein
VVVAILLAFVYLLFKPKKEEKAKWMPAYKK